MRLLTIVRGLACMMTTPVTFVFLLAPMAKAEKKPPEIPEQIRKAWEDAGAWVGWIGWHHILGIYTFSEDPTELSTETLLPAFKIPNWRPKVLARLPKPEIPFGLDLSESDLTDEGLEEIRNLKSLHALLLQGNRQLTSTAGKSLETLENLKILVLRFTKATPSIVTHITHLRHLEVLYLDSVDRKSFQEITKLSELRKLWLGEPWQRFELDVTDIARLAKLKRLQSLRIDFWEPSLKDLEALPVELRRFFACYYLYDDRALEKYSPFFEDIVSLSLSDKPITDQGLAHIRRLRNLQHLHLRNLQISDEGLKHLTGLKNLSTLRLDGIRISGKGLAYLVGLGRLRTLYVINCTLSEEGFRNLGKLTQLEELYFSGVELGEKEFQHLANLSNLRELSLHNAKISSSALKHLAP
ncbi:MAG: hypothetical protein RMI91_09460 [Gemmatales bacterium]|nr:hypothetical protein [Gemmatales bacterium]MDW7994868.1 hypothetical protein [Gemmatales bacterium]